MKKFIVQEFDFFENVWKDVCFTSNLSVCKNYVLESSKKFDGVYLYKFRIVQLISIH